MSEYIGKKLKQLRKTRGLTQDQVSERVDISRSTISNYEIGRRTPNLRDLSALANVFGVGLDYFGITPKDEAFDVLARAKDVFESTSVSRETKEELYRELMRMYLNIERND